MNNYDITLKVTAEQLLSAFEILNNEPPALGFYDSKDQKRMKHFYSLWADLRKKVAQKHLAIDGKKKPSNFKLKYYQAFTLHQILEVYGFQHFHLSAQQLFDQLDQKLS